jgi:hemoglobin
MLSDMRTTTNGDEKEGSDAIAKSVYDRIGREAPIRAAMEFFYRRVLADPSLQPFFADVDVPALKVKQWAFFVQTWGGPANYRGRDISGVHAHLQITQKHFDRMVGHLAYALQPLGVDQQTIDEIVAAMAPLAAEVVTSKE